MMNDLFVHLPIDIGSVGLSSPALRVAAVSSIFAILSTSIMRQEATSPTIHQIITTTMWMELPPSQVTRVEWIG
jgi:hypothetical protein